MNSNSNKSVRNVRNFWVEVFIDGKSVKLAGGPKSKDGGLMVRVYQRENGSVSEVLNVSGASNSDELTLQVDARGLAPKAIEIRTKR